MIQLLFKTEHFHAFLTRLNSRLVKGFQITLNFDLGILNWYF